MTDKIKSSTLKALVGKPAAISEIIEYSDDSVVSKTIVDKPTGTVTLFAFDAGQGLSEHTSPYDALVQVIEGSVQVTIGGNEILVNEGQVIIMPADVPHSLNSDRRFKMVLTMIRA